ncbi:MAG: dihydrofolate reductase [Chloroflexi bacterium]|nr:MAG: dihydrofolate reductase [Chloroflexota bacterium]
MVRLIYAVNMSLDGYIADRDGNFDWGEPSLAVHQFFNDLLRSVGTHLYGRRMYETMTYWETAPTDASPAHDDFAEVWRDADKVVYSTTLEGVSSARTRLERHFDVAAVRTMKAAAHRDLMIGGAGLAAEAIRAGLVDDYHVMVVPVIVGGGTRALPEDARLDLDLVQERRFDSGTVHLHYRPRS